MKRILLLLIASLALVGCGTITNVSSFSVEGLQQYDLKTLCFDYAKYRKHETKLEEKGEAYVRQSEPLVYRLDEQAFMDFEEAMIKKGFPPEEMEAARSGVVEIGMSIWGLYAAKGKPYDENVTRTQSLLRIQHVYGRLGPFYYTENGIVTAYQN